MLKLVVILFCLYLVGLMFNCVSPLSYSWGLLGYSLLVALILSGLSSVWLSVLVVLIFSSGMMVLFLYISSVTNGKPTVVKNKKFWGCLLMAVFILLSGPLFPSEYMAPGAANIYFVLNNFLVILMVGALILCLSSTLMMSESFKGCLMKTKF